MTFSIRYTGNDAYTECAVDWDWMEENQWARSCRDYPGVQWYPVTGLDETSYRAILEHFGLEDYEEEFSLESVITMSPEELADARRGKERLYRLRHKVIESDTIGDHMVL